MLNRYLAVFLMLSLWGSAYAQQPPRGGPGSEWHGERGGERIMGTVVAVGVDRLTVKTAEGKEQIVLVSDQTRYHQQRKELQLEDLKPGDHVIVAGHENADHQFAAMMVGRVTEEQMKQSGAEGDRAFGEIIAIEKNQLTLRNRWQGERVVTVNEQTTFMKEGKASTLQELQVGDRIMAMGKDANGTFTATRVMSGMPPGGGPWGGSRGGQRGGPGGPNGQGPPE